MRIDCVGAIAGAMTGRLNNTGTRTRAAKLHFRHLL